MSEPIKLSPAQQRVVDKMREGWTLSMPGLKWILTSPDDSCCETVLCTTIWALGDRDLIVTTTRLTLNEPALTSEDE